MKKIAILALISIIIRWAIAIALLLAITWAGWECFLHFYAGLPSIGLLEIIGFYCCVIAAGVVIGAIVEVVKNR